MDDTNRKAIGLPSNAEVKESAREKRWYAAFFIYLFASVFLDLIAFHQPMLFRQAAAMVIFIGAAAYALTARFTGARSLYGIRNVVAGIWAVPVIAAGLLVLDI
jgi:hypothetical protein